MGAETAHPIRMLIYNVLTPNFHSSIWWMGTFYGVYLLFLFIVLYFLMTNNLKSAFYAGIIAFLVGISAQSNLGAVFGLLEARPFWHGPYLPIYFILSALISGCALTIIIFNVAFDKFSMPDKYKDALLGISKIFGLLVGALIFFNIWKIRVSLYGAPPEKYEAMMQLLSGQLAFNFWFFEIILGLLLPFLIILFTKGNSIKASLIAAISFVIGAFFMRYDLVIAGQLHPMRAPAPGAGVEGATASGFVTYTPTFTEVAVVIGAVALCIGLYLLAERLLKLDE
jgi:molybdopterin-containing oxidoreductase family membrane subunit